MISRISRAALLVCLSLGCRASPGPPDNDAGAARTLVFAAASTADALEAHAQRFTADTGCSVRFSFASSQDLARQLKLGAPADLFLSADPALVDDLVRQQLVLASNTARWMSNQLVIIVPRDGPAVGSAAELATVPHVALGDPDLVPAGRYARSWLQKTGAWAAVQARVVPALDVRAALAMVESARAEAGIVYRTDAMHSTRVRVTHEIAIDESAPITYRAAQLTRSSVPCARQLMAAWQLPSAREMFARHGFLP